MLIAITDRDAFLSVFFFQLTSTKDVDNKQTLMHYLVDTIERKFPECLSFVEELSHVDRASRVSLENVQRTLRQMETNIRNLEKDLSNAKVPQCDDDLFIDVMKVSFFYIVSTCQSNSCFNIDIICFKKQAPHFYIPHVFTQIPFP